MKKYFLPIAVCIVMLTVQSFISATESGKDSATVNTYQGVFIFTDCKPVSQYDYLGTVEMGMTMGSGQYAEIRDALLKKAKKKFPTCDGLIITFADGGTDKADAVKFK